MFGQIEAMKEQLKARLETIFVEASAADDAIKIQANANQRITNIAIDATKIDLKDTEQLEDLLLVATNRALEAAAAKGKIEMQQMAQNAMPEGLGGLLGNIFNK